MQAAGVSPDTIGQFGVGLLSAFVVAKRIDVFTRKLDAATGFHWVSHGDDDYQIVPTVEAPDCGTETIITLRPEYAHLLDEEELLQRVRLYADFLSVPICVNGNGPVNTQDAPWHKAHWANSDDCRQECLKFLGTRYQDQPLLVVPVSFERPHTRGVLYITDQPIPGVGSSGLVDLYVRRMCVRLMDNELLPEWATFVRGVIDADLQPTAARDNVQRDAAYHRLRRNLGRLLVRTLLDLQKDDPEYFQRLCNWHAVGIKGMALRDEAFFCAVSSFLPFHTNDGVMSLEEYLKRQKPQPSGRRPLYYFTYNCDEARFFQICSANGMLAINAGRLFDEPLIEKYANQQAGSVELQRLDHLNSRQIYAEVDIATTAQLRPLLTALVKVLTELGLPNIRPVLRAFAPDTLATVMLTAPGTDALDRVQCLLQSPYLSGGIQDFAQEVFVKLKGHPTELIVNVNNPLVQALARQVELGSPPVHAALSGLYYLAQLNSHARVKPECVRQIGAYLQNCIKDQLQSNRGVAELRHELAAWRKCIFNKDGVGEPSGANISKGLASLTPGEFRTQVAQANDEELCELLLQFYHQMMSSKKPEP
jgi:molecular chaperone HtpG